MDYHQKEKEVVERIIKGNEVAFFHFYESQKKGLTNFINRKISDPQIVEEIVQDVFLDFIESLRDFRYKSSLKTFLYAIAKNKSIDYIRKRKLKSISISHIPIYMIEKFFSVTIDSEIERNETAEKIKHVIDRLPDDYQMVLRLKYLEGEKVHQIAKVLSMNFKAAESLIYRARKAFILEFKK